MVLLVTPLVTGCPEPEAIEPCTCFLDGYGYKLYCGNISSTAQLNSIFSVDFPEKSFYKLNISQSAIDAITMLPSGVSFKHIELRENFELTQVSPEAFVDSFDTLEVFFVWYTALPSLDFIISNLPQYSALERLTSYYSPVQSIGPLSSQSLEYFAVEYAELQFVSPGEMDLLGDWFNYERLDVNGGA